MTGLLRKDEREFIPSSSPSVNLKMSRCGPNRLPLVWTNLFGILNENNYRNSTFDLFNINLPNKILCVAQDSMDTKGFGTSTEMLMSLMLHQS